MCEESPPPPTAEISQENQVKNKKTNKKNTKTINKAKQLLFKDTMVKPASWRIFFHDVK